MLLRYFYDQALAHASYLVGCQKSGEAVIVDPGRDVEPYLETAKKEGLRIVAVAETHIHADYVSGARELAARVAAKLYVSDEGTDDWKYLYLDEYDHQRLNDSDSFHIGNILFEVIHTPGHTPESISFMLTDQGGGADKPMGIFTGDFIFVGSIGRPDLLEEAAGIKDTAEPGARDLFRSAERFKLLPDYLQIWPAHGAGSACGKGLGAIPSSTVGYEKLFNPALQFTDESEFVKYILSDQPPAPKYFALMKQVNKEGPQILGGRQIPPSLPIKKLSEAISQGTVVDISQPSDFSERHVPDTINIPLHMLAGWGGWVLDYNRPIYLIADDHGIDEAVRVLRKIGVENIAGAFSPSEIAESGVMSESYKSEQPIALSSRIEAGEVELVDVRSAAEWNSGHIEQASHHFLGRLTEQLNEIPQEKPIVTQCQSGMRSAVAASILQAAGKQVINLAGGLNAWKKAGLPVTNAQPTVACESTGAGTCS